MGRSGVNVLLGRQTDRIQKSDLGLTLCFREHAAITVDLVVVSAGITPRGELAVDAGLTCTSTMPILRETKCTRKPRMWPDFTETNARAPHFHIRTECPQDPAPHHGPKAPNTSAQGNALGIH
jgi:hypothetical protein